MTSLDRLDQWKRRHGDAPAPLERLLRSLHRARFDDPRSLLRLHETLLFLRAYPHSRDVARLADGLLSTFASRVGSINDDASTMEEPEVSGIAGTSVSAIYTYETARSLAARHGASIELDWDRYEEPDRMGPALSAIVPLAAEEWPVEAHMPMRQWIEGLKRSDRTSLQWLLERLDALSLTPRQRAELYDRMNLPLTWKLGDSPATRTHGRLADGGLFIHSRPLIPRTGVSLEREFATPPLPFERLGRREARQLLGLIVDTSAVRYRELYGFSHPDLDRVYRAEAGRGLEILFFGTPPEWRLPLRAYHAGMFFKNGIPAGYIEVLSLFERAEVGFNLYYTFREGETAWIYSRLLHLCRQFLGVTHFYLDPYQIGHENEEAIAAGAFWFYRKLGFRSVEPSLARLTQSEEVRIAGRPGYRTPQHTLRKLSARPMIWEPGEGSEGEWDRFQVRTLALARWPAAAQRAFDALRPAKYGPSETRYLRLMRRDAALRAVLLRLGSGA